MKRLLLALCVIALVTCRKKKGKDQKDDDKLQPGAPEGSMLYEMQEGMMQYILSEKGELNVGLTTGLGLAIGDFCSIVKDDAAAEEEHSMILGATCKAEFVKMFKEKPDACGSVLCTATTVIKSEGHKWVQAVVKAKSTDMILRFIEKEFLNDIFEYICRCGSRLMDGVTDVCIPNIQESSVWDMMTQMVDADDLGLPDDTDLKQYFLDIIQNKIDWENISTFVDRLVSNLCMANADDPSGESQCYHYFYNSFKTGYRWWMMSGLETMKPEEREMFENPWGPGKPPRGPKPGPRPKGPGPGPRGPKPGPGPRGPKPGPGPGFEKYPEECTSFDFTAIMKMTYAKKVEYAQDKLCNKGCEDTYKKTFMGCCSSNMVLDEEMIEALSNVTENAKNLKMMLTDNDVYPEDFDYSVVGLMKDMYDVIVDPQCEADEAQYGLKGCKDVTPATKAGRNKGGRKFPKDKKDKKNKKDKNNKSDKKGAKGKSKSRKGNKGKAETS